MSKRNFHPISVAEMAAFMERNKFKVIRVPNTHELVYGRREDWVRIEGDREVYRLPFSLRVYTSLTLQGARNVGEDAIRVSVWGARLRDTQLEYFMIGGAKRVNRIQTWADNLQHRIDNWVELLEPLCPLCGAPMMLRKSDHGRFYGCLRFHTDRCRGQRKLEDVS